VAESTWQIWHYDLYRVEHESELLELAIDEALYNGICLIEWPERGISMLPVHEALHIELLYTDESFRTLKMTGDLNWRNRIEARGGLFEYFKSGAD
jgi:tRNA A37 threonylcarbamoyladenosine biosynthesis protein TsaE